ncbi:hypothetical protein EQG41_11105 [Billgrantia azerbaijanica]|nr:hypothetical protein EQG41_11105 [Halomonas azerbaijanica]
MTTETTSGSYLLHNNPRMDMAALEARLEALLAERPALPPSCHPLPSAAPVRPPSLARRWLIACKQSAPVQVWLPRYPRLHRTLRGLYHRLKRLAGR